MAHTEKLQREIKLDTVYKHTPSGGKYRTIELLHDATGYESTGEVEESVRYRQITQGEKFPAGTVWVRRTEDFLGTTEVDGREVPIFEEVPREDKGDVMLANIQVIRNEPWRNRARGV